MNRLKFRVWNEQHERFEYWGFTEDSFVSPPNGFGIKYLYENSEQYLGYQDMNGKEIYEGDIAQNDRGECGIVVYSKGSFWLEYYYPYNWDPMEPADRAENIVKVFANKHETPELIEVSRANK